MICSEFGNICEPTVEQLFKREFYNEGEGDFQLREMIIKNLQLPDENSNLQFVFGGSENIAFGACIPEFDDKDGGIYTSAPYKMVSLFEKYFKQNNNVFVFKDSELQKWFFYDIDDVISIICESSTWKILENGRIRGYIKDKRNTHQYITYEPSEGTMFFGISHTKENRFNEFLKSKIAKYECDCAGVVTI